MKKTTLVLAGFLLLKFVLQYAMIHPVYDLQRDEYLHIDQAHHPAWGYLSVPPFTSWNSMLIGWLGNTVFWIKFFPALYGALTMLVVWKTTEALKGNLLAMVLGAVTLLFSVLLRLNTLYQPNSPDVLCWTSLLYFMVRYHQTQKSSWIYAAALAFAIGFLNKYNIIFLLTGLCFGILATKERKLFFKKELWIAAGLVLLLVLPNLIWQYRNDFPVLHHMKLLQESQLKHVNRIDFLKDQLLFFVGALPLFFAGMYALWRKEIFRPYRFLFPTFVAVIALFTGLQAKSYYSAGLYPIYFAFGAVHLSAIAQRRKWLQPVLFVFPLLCFVPMYRYVFPNHRPEYIIAHKDRYQLLGLLRWEDGKEHAIPQDFADMLGWKELAQKTDSVCAAMTNPAHTLLFCDNYGQAGAINYYSRSEKIRAQSLNADYLNWMDTVTNYKDIILVKEPGDDDPERLKEKAIFDTVYLAAQRVHPYALEDTISIYVCKGARIDLRPLLRKEIEKRKKS